MNSSHHQKLAEALSDFFQVQRAEQSSQALQGKNDLPDLGLDLAAGATKRREHEDARNVRIFASFLVAGASMAVTSD